MSHWKVFTSEVLTDTNLDILGRALKEMGVTLDTSIKEIANTWGREKVDMGFVKGNEKLSLGFKKVGNKLELRGDFFLSGLREDTFINQVSQLYTKEDILEKINNRSQYTVDSMTTNENGEIEILAYCYA